MVFRLDSQARESFTTTYEDELKDVAKAVGSGKLAEIAGAGAAFYVKWTTGSSIAAAFAGATVEKVAALFGQWLLEHKPELESAARGYLEPAATASEREALEVYLLQRTETMYEGTRLVLVRHGYAAHEPGLEKRAEVPRLASALENMLPIEREHGQLQGMLQSAAQQREGRAARLAAHRERASEARRLERAGGFNLEYDRGTQAEFVREHERVLERQSSWQFQSPQQVSRSVLLDEEPLDEEPLDEEPLDEEPLDEELLEGQRSASRERHHTRQRERS